MGPARGRDLTPELTLVGPAPTRYKPPPAVDRARWRGENGLNSAKRIVPVGLKDLFSSSGRSKSRLDKLIKTVTNKYTQSAERFDAMEKLLADGSDEALVGLFKRFTIASTKSIEDEEEKGWAYRQLSGLGSKALPAAKTFCLAHDNIAWALRVVEDVADEEQEWEILDALLEVHPPEYERDPGAKLQMLRHLAEIEDDKVPATLIRYVDDPDEGIRFFAVEQLIEIADASCKEPLIARLGNPKEDSHRLRARILDGLAQLDWDVSDHEKTITANLGSDHLFKAGKVVKR